VAFKKTNKSDFSIFAKDNLVRAGIARPPDCQKMKENPRRI
jgi:hypothetical protein